MTVSDIENMETDERIWYLERLIKQLRKEKAEIKKASKGK